MPRNWMSILGPKIKPALFPYWLFSRVMTLGVRCAAFDANGYVCLVKHTYTPGWHFPGGGVEVGETALSALEKELLEEAGITLQEAPQLVGAYANSNASRRDHVLFFVARNWTQQEIPLPTREIAETGMFDPLDLPSGTAPGTQRRLAEILHEHPAATVW